MNLLQKLLDLVFQVDGKVYVDSFARLSERMATGIEGITCSYNPDDDDHKNGFVTIDCWLGDVDDTQYVEKEIFFEAISQLCKDCTDITDAEAKKLNIYLNKIKMDLKI